MTRMVCPLRATASRHPNAPAVVGPSGEVLTYKACDSQAQAVAAALRSKGIEPGNRVAFVGPVEKTTVPILFGAFRAGVAVYLPNVRMPETALRERTVRVGCSHVIGGKTIGIGLPLLDPTELAGHPSGESPTDMDAGVPATIIATSGSTAAPKMAVHSVDNHVANAEASNRNITVEPGDRWLLSLSLYHVAGLGIVFRCVLGGAGFALPNPDEPLEESIARLNVTHVSLVTTQLQRLLENRVGTETLRRLKAILLGGSAIPRGLVERAVHSGVPIHTTYGLTETASQVTTTPPGADMNTLSTSGRPLTRGTVRTAQDGEIEVSGRTLFLGYLTEDGSIYRPATPDGWLPTGDIGHFDTCENLVVTGRKDNLFISGGENIQPEEIEAVLCAFDDVARAIVVPVPDPEFGHRPLAFIEPAPGFSLNPYYLRRHLGNRLPRYKLPVAYLPWPADTRETGIKPSRRFFQELAAQKWR
ncbi:MAG: o-succinylbenzoate--CoA ligase [Candidatus Hydrogenedentota bacterium]